MIHPLQHLVNCNVCNVLKIPSWCFISSMRNNSIQQSLLVEDLVTQAYTIIANVNVRSSYKLQNFLLSFSTERALWYVCNFLAPDHLNPFVIIYLLSCFCHYRPKELVMSKRKVTFGKLPHLGKERFVVDAARPESLLAV